MRMSLHSTINPRLTDCTDVYAEITCIDISPCSRFVACGSTHHTMTADGFCLTQNKHYHVKILSSDTFDVIKSFEDVHADAINSIKFSHNGKLLASVSADKSICIWDVETWDQRINQLLHSSFIHTVQFTHDDLTVITTSFDNIIKFSHLHRNIDGRVDKIDEIRALQSISYALAISQSPNNEHVAFSSEDNNEDCVTICNINDCNIVARLSIFINYGILYSIDGNSLICSSRLHNGIDVYDTRLNYTMNNTITTGHLDRVVQIDHLPDKKHIFTTSLDKSLRIFNCKTWNPIAVMQFGGFIHIKTVAWSNNCKHLFVGHIIDAIYSETNVYTMCKWSDHNNIHFNNIIVSLIFYLVSIFDQGYFDVLPVEMFMEIAEQTVMLILGCHISFNFK